MKEKKIIDSNNEKRKLLMQFIEEYSQYFSENEKRIILSENTTSSKKLLTDVTRQVFTELGFIKDEDNIYQAFIDIIKEEFGLERNIVEIGGGVVPSLAKKIALSQNKGTITVYDPRLINNMYSNIPNLKLKRQAVSTKTQIEQADLYVAFMPCEATQTIIDIAGKNKVDFIIAACEGGPHGDIYDYFEDEEEWLHSMIYHARRQIEYNDLGTLETKSLQKYNDPYPVFFNRRSR